MIFMKVKQMLLNRISEIKSYIFDAKLMLFSYPTRKDVLMCSLLRRSIFNMESEICILESQAKLLSKRMGGLL